MIESICIYFSKEDKKEKRKEKRNEQSQFHHHASSAQEPTQKSVQEPEDKTSPVQEPTW